MYTFSITPDRKIFKTNSKRNLENMAPKVRPGLALDTTVGRHRGLEPQQVYPYESKTEELAPQKPRRGGGFKGSIREQIESRLPAKVAGYKQLEGDGGEASTRETLAVHRRVKGLKPPPLQLNSSISPSDRAIPIGISLPSSSLSKDNGFSSTQLAIVRTSPPRTGESFPNGGITPTIIITPAKERFGLSQSPDELEPHYRFRPTSSVYSRYTNGALKGLMLANGNAKPPPVPPLPLFSEPAHLDSTRLQDTRASATTVFEEHDKHRSRNAALSMCTGFEDMSPMTSTYGSLRSAPIRDSRRVTRQSHLPTPMRNKGWWNVITSPFSAGAASTFWRSPTIDEGKEMHHKTPAVKEAYDSMGFSNPLFGRIFNGRKDGDDELRSAPPDHVDDSSLLRDAPSIQGGPKRSFTAPSAIDRNSSAKVNIYRTPSQGAAAAYYDMNRHFPSLILPACSDLDSEPRSVFSPDTPENMNYLELQRQVADLEEEAVLKSAVKDEDLEARLAALEARLIEMEAAKGVEASGSAADEYEDNPFADFDQNDTARPASGVLHSAHPDNLEATGSPVGDVYQAPLKMPDGPIVTPGNDPMHTTASRAVFATPSAEELATPMPHMPPRISSPPLSPSPVVEHAHIAQVMGPDSFNGEQREVDITSARTPALASIAGGLGLADATMHSQAGETSRDIPPIHGEAASFYQRPVMHSRQSSYGLGISGGNHSPTDSQAGLFPPSQPQSKRISEKFTLGTDRFRQLTIRSLDEPQKSHQPWYKRFFWLLVATAITLFLLMIVLLVVLIPQKHGDVAVQAQWLNLTGFPALPTGISTVIQPRAMKNEGKCVQSGIWSCAATPIGSANQKSRRDDAVGGLPNFRFEIRFRNHTSDNNTALTPQKMKRRSSLSTLASSNMLQARNDWSIYLYSSLPSPPSEDDQMFLGRTTDNVSEPYNGLETPFFISLLDAQALHSGDSSKEEKKVKRRNGGSSQNAFQYPYPTSSSNGANAVATSTTISVSTGTSNDSSATSSVASSTRSSDSQTSNTATPSPSPSTSSMTASGMSSSPSNTSSVATEAPKSIPRLPVKSNGKANPPTLYPQPSSQPLRLYNQGQDDEYYGFYTYFDRSILISSSSLLSNSSTTPNKNAGQAFCTFSQTRLHVQIWTRKGTIASLNTTTNSATEERTAAANSSANTMTAPGSFPYPVTVTIDRHGGKADDKGVFCYGVDDDGYIVDDAKLWIDEDRGVDGTLVNPAGVPSNDGGNGSASRMAKQGHHDDNDKDYDAYGGIDGGSGGCACAWSSGS